MQKLSKYALRRIVVICTLLVVNNFYSCIGTEPRIKSLVKSSMESMRLLKAGGKIDKNLLALLKLYELKHDGTPEGVNKAMQKNLLRQRGKERRDLKENEHDQVLKEKALLLYRAMGFIDGFAHTPTNDAEIDHFLVFGAMIGAVEKRFKDFVAQYNQGLRCKHLALLGGVRKLREHEIKHIEEAFDEESLRQFLSSIHKERETLTEADLFRFVWERYATADMRTDFKEGVNLFFINATTKTAPNNRPNTRSTIEAWYEACQPQLIRLHSDTEYIRIHSNTEQPYAMRMEKTLRGFLEKKSKALPKGASHFSITWNCTSASKETKLPVLNDELAREFYTESVLDKILKGK